MYKQLIISICFISLLGISVLAGEIHQAAETGDITTIKALLEKDPDMLILN